MRFQHCCLIAIAAFLTAARAQSAIRYVNAVRPDDSGDGLSWATAEKTLQAALAAALNGDQIWVAAGTYKPDQGGGQILGNRSAKFQLLNGVGLYGGFAGGETLLTERNPAANVTILTGDLAGNDAAMACTQDVPDCASFGSRCADGFCILSNNMGENSYHVVNAGFTSVTSVLDGFTITGGNANFDLNDDGGGIHNLGGSPTIANCVFRGNTTVGNGGAIYNFSGASPVIRNCNFFGNFADNGGAITNYTGCNPTIRDCTFTVNSALYAGAMMNWDNSSSKLVGCTFVRNRAQFGGGAIINWINASPYIFNCRFYGNSAQTAGAMQFSTSSNGQIVNGIFTGNSASSTSGGAVWISEVSAPEFRNCTFASNVAELLGGGVASQSSIDPTFHNCVFWNNRDAGGTGASGQIHSYEGDPRVRYSIVQGGWAGTGSENLNADPLFIDADGPDNVAGTLDDNLEVALDSPAIDSGNNAFVPADFPDVDDDMNIVEPTPWDVRGKSRFVDVPFIADGGNGTPPIVDRGAIESQPPLLVDASATGSNNGLTWANAYTRLQDALSYAVTHPEISEIWVADGTYRPTDKSCTVDGDCGGGAPNSCPAGVCVWDQRRQQTFQLLNGVALNGGFAGGETSLSQRNPAFNVTILSGDLAGDDAPVACSQDSPDCNALGNKCLDGACIVRQNMDENSYHVVTASGTDFTAELSGFTITGGNADANDAVNGTGAGLLNIAGSPTVTDCIFRANSAEGFATGGGGGMRIDNAGNPLVARCDFIGNRGSHGGGLRITASTDPTIVNCRFLGNSAGVGGAVSCTSPTHRAVNCLFSGNVQTMPAASGGAYYLSSSSAELFQCTFANNIAAGTGGAIFTSAASPKFYNCIFWQNAANGGANQDESGQIFVNTGTVTVTYSTVMGLRGLAGNGNIGSDPLFIDADGPDDVAGTEDDDLRLMPGSPAVDAGDSTALPLDTDDADEDGNTTERYPFDLAGNPRILDDPATDDTGVAGSGVVDMGAYEFFADCNGNGLPDICDMDCGPAMGACDIPGCGTGGDCDWSGTGPNGILDECDIDACVGDFDCGDCNLNARPDACDIANMTSTDTDMNGIPDECVEFVGGCVNDSDWTCFDNWAIPGDVYPDNAGMQTYSVTLDDLPGPDPDVVDLDTDITVDTLAIINGATLNVTQTGSEGDLTLAEAGGLLLEGTLIAGPGRVIDVTAGRILIRGSGRYTGPPVRALRAREPGPITKSPNHQITPSSVDQTPLPYGRGSDLGRGSEPRTVPICGNGVCDEGETGCSCPQDQSVCGACIGGADTVIQSCDPCPPGMCPPDECGLFLGEGMDHETENLTLNGLLPDGTPAASCDVAGVRGLIIPPPKFRATVDADVTVIENIILQGSVVFHHSSSSNLQLGGDFNNQATVPQCFDWSQGGMTLTGTAARTFEVAGQDLGPVPAGFDTGLDTNFSMETLEVGPGASVRFINGFANTVGAGPCLEALYVRNLILRAGSSVTLEGSRVYYDTLVDEGATINDLGCGEDERTTCGAYPDCSDENICTDDRCEAGHCTHTPIAELVYGDLYRETVDFPPGPADVDDLVCIVAAFGGIFSETCPMERTDLFPCDADVPAELVCTTDSYCQAILSVPCIRGRCLVVDVDDLTAVVQSFAGQFSCPHPCGP